ncbi:MAG: hypothetical protein KC553_06115 [Nitrospina sp.]|nr:hypothetical protein [Nitrospina sp.]
MKLESPQARQKVPNFTETSPRSHRILVIRSASRTYPKALAALRQEFPNARFTILTENPGALKEGEEIETLIPLPPGRRISWFSFGPAKRLDLRRRKFDLAAVLYNTAQGRGYANVESLAWSSGAKAVRGYFPDGGFRCLSGGAVFRNTVTEQTALGWVALNLVMTSILLLVFTVLMAGEAVIRLFQRKPSPRRQPPAAKPL